MGFEIIVTIIIFFFTWWGMNISQIWRRQRAGCSGSKVVGQASFFWEYEKRRFF